MSVAGKFAIVVDSPIGQKEGFLDYVVDGDVLTGSASALGETTEIFDGKVDGNTFSHMIKMKIKTKAPMNKIKMQVSGTVDGDTVSGEFKMALASMPFTGTRVQEQDTVCE
jgi:hypothetical protein